MNPGELQTFSGIEQGIDSFANAFADISQADFVSNQFKLNEQLAGIQSQEAITAGNVEQQISQQRTAQLSGQQVAAEAAQGSDIHTGTAEITRSQTGEIGGQDYLTLGNNAFLKSLGYKIQGENDASQSTLEQASGITKAANSLLSGGNDMFQSSMKALSYKQQENAPTAQQIDSTITPNTQD